MGPAAINRGPQRALPCLKRALMELSLHLPGEPAWRKGAASSRSLPLRTGDGKREPYPDRRNCHRDACAGYYPSTGDKEHDVGTEGVGCHAGALRERPDGQEVVHSTTKHLRPT